MDSIFWVGLVLGGLLGVAFDLWKRPLDRLLDRRTASRVESLAKEVQTNRRDLRDYLVEVILQTTLVGSLIGILSGLAFGVSSDLVRRRKWRGLREMALDIGRSYHYRASVGHCWRRLCCPDSR